MYVCVEAYLCGYGKSKVFCPFPAVASVNWNQFDNLYTQNANWHLDTWKLFACTYTGEFVANCNGNFTFSSLGFQLS